VRWTHGGLSPGSVSLSGFRRSIERGGNTVSIATVRINSGSVTPDWDVDFPSAVDVLISVMPGSERALPCRTEDADMWFAEGPDRLGRAQELCQECPIRRQCLAAALSRREPWGVWGGEIFERGRVIPFKRGRGRPARSRQDLPRATDGLAASA
jgi:WhiB family transcriptional regulator, redox-sensing transcriptional regulator